MSQAYRECKEPAGWPYQAAEGQEQADDVPLHAGGDTLS